MARRYIDFQSSQLTMATTVFRKLVIPKNFILQVYINQKIMARYQIACINKRGSHYGDHERISHIGGLNNNGTRWKLTEEEAIQLIEHGKHQFFVSVKGQSVEVIIALHGNRKYLKTTADGYSPNNLLNLPECQ